MTVCAYMLYVACARTCSVYMLCARMCIGAILLIIFLFLLPGLPSSKKRFQCFSNVLRYTIIYISYKSRPVTTLNIIRASDTPLEVYGEYAVTKQVKCRSA